ncbi:MAG: hypothetical protein ABJA62_12045 [Luteimonas sp.]
MPAHVYVDQTTCKSSVDSSDDIYLLVFRGSTTSPFNNSMSVIHPSAFADFDDGESRGNDIQVARYFADRVYVVALMERDADNDFLDNNAGPLELIRAQANLAWVTRMASLSLAHHGTIDDDDRKTAADLVITAMQGTIDISTRWPIGDDDEIGRAKYLKIAPGEEPVLTYSGGGGNYRIRFKVKPN